MSVNVPPPRDHTSAAFGLSLGLHLAVLMLLPQLEQTPSPPPLRVEIDLTQAAPPPETPPQPTPPQPEPPKPTPRPAVAKATPQPQQQAMPILAARDDTPPTPQDHVVPDIPAPATPAPVTPSAPVVDAQAESAPVSATSSASANTQATTSNEADPSAAWDGYGQMLYDMVSKNKTYPQIAIRRHLQGQAKVSARFEMGRLAALTLLEPGSGHAVLDNAAMEMLKKAVNALPIRGELAGKSFTVVVPVDFRIEG